MNKLTLEQRIRGLGRAGKTALKSGTKKFLDLYSARLPLHFTKAPHYKLNEPHITIAKYNLLEQACKALRDNHYKCSPNSPLHFPPLTGNYRSDHTGEKRYVPITVGFVNPGPPSSPLKEVHLSSDPDGSLKVWAYDYRSGYTYTVKFKPDGTPEDPKKASMLENLLKFPIVSTSSELR